MIAIAYLERDGVDWFRKYKEFKDDKEMKSTAKAKSFMNRCIEQNKRSSNGLRYKNFRIIVGGRLINSRELLTL